MRVRDVNLVKAVITDNQPGSIENIDDDFVFTGFGSNDKKNKTTPTDGSYTITRGHRYVEGTYHLWEIYRPSGVVTQNKLWQGPLWQVPDGTSLQNQWLVDDGTLSNVVYNRALDQLYSTLKADSNLNLFVSAAEYRESRRMIAGAAAAVGSMIKSARKLRRLVVTNPSLLLSSGWLAYTYGWKPLYQDLYNCFNFHYKLFNEIEARGRARGSNSELTVVKPAWITTQTKKDVSQRWEVKVIATVNDDDAYNLSRATSLDPLLIAWEAMPLSFVVDWVWNVGGYLELLEASVGRGLVFKRGYATSTRKREVKKVLSGTNTVPRVYYDYWYGTFIYDRNDYCYAEGSREEITKVRVSLQSFPRPVFPSFKVNMGAKRIMSAASLIRTILLPRHL